MTSLPVDCDYSVSQSSLRRKTVVQHASDGVLSLARSFVRLIYVDAAVAADAGISGRLLA